MSADHELTAGGAVPNPGRRAAEREPLPAQGLSEEDLNREYGVTQAISNREAILQGFVDRSVRFRHSNAGIRNVRFGATRDEVLDLFFPTRSDEPAPVVVFLHGGYWYQFTKEEWSFIAAELCRRGVLVAIPTYSLCPGVTLTEIVRQMQGFIQWLHRSCETWGGDPTRIYLAGHSAGGHLAVTLARTPWRERYGIPADVIKGVVSISGVFDLGPVSQSYVQNHVRLAEREITEFSHVSSVEQGLAPLSALVGDLETSEFQRQSEAMCGLWHRAGNHACFEKLPNRNHLDILDEFGAGGRILGALMDQVDSSAP